MQPIDSESPEQAIPEVVIGEEQQASAQVKGLLRTFSALRHRNYRLFFRSLLRSPIFTSSRSPCSLVWDSHRS
jgi:hypothetical protein